MDNNKANELKDGLKNKSLIFSTKQNGYGRQGLFVEGEYLMDVFPNIDEHFGLNYIDHSFYNEETGVYSDEQGNVIDGTRIYGDSDCRTKDEKLCEILKSEIEELIDNIAIEKEEMDMNKNEAKEEHEEHHLVGEILFYGFDGNVGEVMKYTDNESYLNAIKKELDYNPDGFKHQTISDDPQLRKSVDDLIYGAYGVDNPHDLDWYSPKVENTAKNRITDIHVFSLKTGGMAVSCKIDGVKQSGKKMSREDVINFNDKTDRKQLVSKYFADTLKKDPAVVKKEAAQRFTSKNRNNKPKHKF